MTLKFNIQTDKKHIYVEKKRKEKKRKNSIDLFITVRDRKGTDRQT
jgi:hypothetical protein